MRFVVPDATGRTGVVGVDLKDLEELLTSRTLRDSRMTYIAGEGIRTMI